MRINQLNILSKRAEKEKKSETQTEDFFLKSLDPIQNTSE